MRTPLCSCLLFLLSIVLPGCMQQARPPKNTRTAAEIAAGYKNFQQVTKSLVFVNPELAFSCVGVSAKEVDGARARFGPHANTGILIFMNDVAATAFITKVAQYPVGAVVVKEKKALATVEQNGKYEAAENGVGGMVKRSPGFDPEHGDWEYFYFEDRKKIESGRIASCVLCHESAKEKDYVFGTWNDTAR